MHENTGKKSMSFLNISVEQIAGLEPRFGNVTKVLLTLTLVLQVFFCWNGKGDPPEL